MFPTSGSIDVNFDVQRVKSEKMGAKKWEKGANTKVHLICMKIGGKYNFGVLILKFKLIFENFDVQRVKLEKMGAKKWRKGAKMKDI